MPRLLRRARNSGAVVAHEPKLCAADPLGRGLEHREEQQNNAAMKIKPTQIYGWDSEPVDERPSEFMSTGYSHLSGFYPQTEAPIRRRAKASVFGFKSIWLIALAVIGLGAFAIDKLVPLLRT